MEISELLKQSTLLAAKFAGGIGESKLETEHMLYGILATKESNSARLLASLGVTEESFKKVIFSYLNKNIGERVTEIAYSKSVAEIFAKADNFCAKNSIKTIETEEILYFMLLNENLKATKFLKFVFKLDINNLKIKLKSLMGENLDYGDATPRANVSALSSSEKTQNASSASNYVAGELPEELSSLGINLSKKIAAQKDFQVIGRDAETERVIEILCRKTKNNPVLIGEPGVGKSAVVEGLALRILQGNVPSEIFGKVIFSLDLASLMSGTKFRGSMEQKLKTAIDAILAHPEIIVFIDEIHMLAESSSKSGEISPSDILKPYLARGELHCIGATTNNEHKLYIEKDPALERRFQPVSIEEPSEEDTIKILKGIRPSFENFHGVKISDEAIVLAVKLSIRYITSRFLPDKAIDLIDEACSKMRVGNSKMPDEVVEINKRIAWLENEKERCIKAQEYARADEINKEKKALAQEIENIKTRIYESTGKSFGEITGESIREVVSSWTKIPVNKLTSSDREKLLMLEDILSSRVIGQSEAVSVVAKAIRRSSADINDPKKPIGSFLFLGPTGVGKTELTKALGDVMFDSEDAIIRFDMSEFKESHSISRLIGAPPGYVGHEAGGELTEAVKRRPYSIVLFDEIEKAHPDIFNILLQVLDDGRLTDSNGKLINFKNTIIILTSNNGVQDLLARRKYEREHPEDVAVETQEFLMDKLRDNFKPELLNRIDSIVIFDSLNIESLRKISDIMLSSLTKRLAEKGISITFSESAKQLICTRGYDELYGARPLRRVIEQQIKNPLSELIISERLVSNSAVRVTVENGEFKFDILC